jgi:hypothetical protein
VGGTRGVRAGTPQEPRREKFLWKRIDSIKFNNEHYGFHIIKS